MKNGHAKIPFLSAALLIITLTLTFGCESRFDDLDLSMYQYRDTRNLVRFVYDAAQILQKEGLPSLTYFQENRPLYYSSDYYLYIYNIDGTNVFHAGMPELEGRDLREITDKNGKKITYLVWEALADENNPHAWIHYIWWEPGKFYPVPKLSCHFQVTTPEGNEFYVGGGIDYPHEEREFIRIIVDGAVQLIEDIGQEALLLISDPTSRFNYRDVSVFVFRPDGEMILSPAIISEFSQTNLLRCQDEVGHTPFIKAVQELETTDRIWEVFMARNRYKRELIKKCLYVRKTIMAGETVYVAAITDLPEPPY